MDVEKQPEPVPLGVAKELLEKELGVRENRLRCVDCGHFQAVPDVEPETNKSEDEAWNLFKFSNIYLYSLFICLVIDSKYNVAVI